MIRINLQQGGPKAKKRKAAAVDSGAGGGGPSTILPAMMLVLPLAGGVGGSFYVHQDLLGRIEDTALATRTAEAEIARLKPVLDELEQFKKDRELLERKLAAIRALEGARRGPVRVLAELGAIMPPQVWVTGVRESGGNAHLDGIGLDSQSVAVFVNAMQRSSYFTNVELTSVEQTSYLGLKARRFNVTCRFRISTDATTAAQGTAAQGTAPAGAPRK